MTKTEPGERPWAERPRRGTDLSELLADPDRVDILRSITEAVLRRIKEADLEGLIGAGRHERFGERTTWCNGYRGRHCRGTLGVRISHRVSMRSDGWDGQAQWRPPPLGEAILQQLCAPQERVNADLAGQGDGLECTA
jgi:hypothetical protein